MLTARRPTIHGWLPPESARARTSKVVLALTPKPWYHLEESRTNPPRDRWTPGSISGTTQIPSPHVHPLLAVVGSSWYGKNPPRFPRRFFNDTVSAKRCSRSSGVKTNSCLSRLPFCKGASASTVTWSMPAYSLDWVQSPRNSRPPSVHLECRSNVATTSGRCTRPRRPWQSRPVASGPRPGSSCRDRWCSRPEWTDQSDDTVELVRAWDSSLSRRLRLRVGVTVCASTVASDILEHCRFRVGGLQHLQNLPSRRMSQISEVIGSPS